MGPDVNGEWMETMFTLFEPVHAYGQNDDTTGAPERVTKQEICRIFSQELQRGPRKAKPQVQSGWTHWAHQMLGRKP